MQTLATAWACDRSNATWVVDRLEDRRLAARRPLAGDRRVKLVVLTKLGMKTRTALRKELYRAPPELLLLDRGDLEVLRAAAAKLRADS